MVTMNSRKSSSNEALACSSSDWLGTPVRRKDCYSKPSKGCRFSFTNRAEASDQAANQWRRDVGQNKHLIGA
jgi:hypothetical protein